MMTSIKLIKLPIMVALSLALASCTKTVRSITRLQALEEGVSSPSTIEELQDAIKKYQNRIVDIQSAQAKVGIWYKMLGTRYLDQEMYGEALECFREAVSIYPDNQNLYYYIGICATFMSHASLDFNATGSQTAKFNYLKLAEDSFLRAVDIEPRYVRALYALGVLYTFELKESDKAIGYLEKLLTIDKKHIDAMTVLAGAYYASGDYDKSVAMYDKIMQDTKSEDTKAMAQSNRQKVLEKKAYGY